MPRNSPREGLVTDAEEGVLGTVVVLMGVCHMRNDVKNTCKETKNDTKPCVPYVRSVWGYMWGDDQLGMPERGYGPQMTTRSTFPGQSIYLLTTGVTKYVDWSRTDGASDGSRDERELLPSVRLRRLERLVRGVLRAPHALVAVLFRSHARTGRAAHLARLRGRASRSLSDLAKHMYD